jgi:N utilization substance protein B
MGNSEASIDPRRLARLLAIQYLFTKLMGQKNKSEFSVFEPNALLSMLEEKKYNTRLYEQIIEGVEQNREDIDEIIQKYAPQWPLDQINPVDHVVLQIAVFEGFVGEITPPKVIINEAVDISKIVSSQHSSKFINGVLGTLLADRIGNNE